MNGKAGECHDICWRDELDNSGSPTNLVIFIALLNAFILVYRLAACE